MFNTNTKERCLNAVQPAGKQVFPPAMVNLRPHSAALKTTAPEKALLK